MKGSVRGLTTAAGIWMAAALGMAVGVGMYVVALVATALILFILMQLERIEHRIQLGKESRIIRMEIAEIIQTVDDYKDILAKSDVTLTNYYLACNYDARTTSLNFLILASETTDFLRLFDSLRVPHPTRSISLANQVSI